MSKHFDKTIGRMRLEYYQDYGAGQCVVLSVRDGWNDSCPILENRLSLGEVTDLQYLLGRMIYAASALTMRRSPSDD